MAEPSRKKQRRHLNYDKCRFCRHAKKACTPIDRIWPHKCHRCIELELDCSENTRVAGAPPLVPTPPVSQVVKTTSTQEIYDWSLRVTWLRRLKLYQKALEVTIKGHERLFGLQSREPHSQLPWEFIRNEEASLFARVLDENTVLHNPFTVLVTLLCDTEVVSLRDHPLYPSCTAALEAIIDRLRAEGDIGTALALQEFALLDKRNRPHKEISAAELQKYCETYTQTWERLKIITGEVPALPPLHYLLLLTQGKVRFPSDLSQIRLRDYFGRSLLHLALDLGLQEDALRYMEFDINATVPSDSWGRLPVHIACSGNSKAVAEYFLNSNVDLCVVDVLGYSALHYAAASGNGETVHMLHRRGANVDCKGIEGYSPLAQAARRGHTSTVQVLALNGADINTKDGRSQTPLFIATKEGHQATVQLLLEKGADIDSKDKYGCTPLSEATRKGHTDIVQLFLEKGADVDSKDKDGCTPLSEATRKGHTDIVQLLLEKGADVDSKYNFGETVLSIAIENGHTDIVRLILEKGVDVDSKYNFGETLLSMAIRNRHTDIVQLLLEKGVDVNSEAGSGFTPLSWAIIYNHTDIARLFLEKGADVDSKDHLGKTPLSIAILFRRTDIARLLVEKGANS